MKNIFTFLLLVFIGGQFLWGQPANLVWNTQSRNASESMPCGGGDIGHPLISHCLKVLF